MSTKPTKPLAERIRPILLFQAQVKRVIEFDVEIPVMSTNRSIPRKEQARLARELFKKLGIKGVSVTAPVYAMASVVDVRLPRLSALGSSDYLATTGDRVLEHKTRAYVNTILTEAFPNHDDRSDTMTDYFDYCWSIS